MNALKNEAKNVVGTYAMAAYAEDTAGRQFSAIVTIEQRTGAVAGVEVYDVTHAVSGRQKRSERAGTKPQGVHPSTNASSKITIADSLKIVNSTYQSILPEDVLHKFGEQRNPQGDYTGKVKFSSQEGRYRDLMGEKAAQYVRRLESGLVNELAENLNVPGQAKRKNSLSKNRRGNFSFARYPNNAMDKHDMFGAVHTWHPRDDSNVRPFA